MRERTREERESERKESARQEEDGGVKKGDGAKARRLRLERSGKEALAGVGRKDPRQGSIQAEGAAEHSHTAHSSCAGVCMCACISQRRVERARGKIGRPSSLCWPPRCVRSSSSRSASVRRKSPRRGCGGAREWPREAQAALLSLSSSIAGGGRVWAVSIRFVVPCQRLGR